MGRVPKKGLTSVAGSGGKSCGQTQASYGEGRKGALHANLAPDSSQNPGNLGKSQPIPKNPWSHSFAMMKYIKKICSEK